MYDNKRKPTAFRRYPLHRGCTFPQLTLGRLHTPAHAIRTTCEPPFLRRHGRSRRTPRLLPMCGEAEEPLLEAAFSDLTFTTLWDGQRHDPRAEASMIGVCSYRH